ncbi:MAG: ABC transporter permease [Oscillochloris sp.]|nr:ABC transporter permease [Oscillochloris sp.]
MSEANDAMRVPAAGEGLDTTKVSQLAIGISAKPRTLIGDAWRRFRRHRLALIGVSVLVFFTLAVTLGTIWYRGYLTEKLVEGGMPLPGDSTELRVLIDHLDFLNLLSSPSEIHLAGTDDLGRDLMARLLYGGRISLLVGLVAMLIAISLGTVIGAVAGFFGGQIDQILMRVTDLFLSLPGVPVTLLIVYLFRQPLRPTADQAGFELAFNSALYGAYSTVTGVFGPQGWIFTLVVTVIGGLAWMSTARIVRASFLSLKEKEFVEAATALGVGKRAIMFRHILPNAIGPVIVAATLEVGNAIIAESTLSFLGVGFPPDTPTWGRLVTDGSQYLQAAPWLALFPGLLIFLTVLSINFIGDGLRDALDPRSRL